MYRINSHFFSNCLHMPMNINSSHGVISKRLLSIIKSLDDELKLYVPFKFQSYQDNGRVNMMPIIWIGTKIICPFPICGLADGWGSGYNESVMFCFFDYFVQSRWYKWYKNHKNFIQNLVFITTNYAPVICNHPPPHSSPPQIHTHTHTHTNGEQRGQRLFIHYSTWTCWEA